MTTDLPEGKRRCSKCQEVKDVDEFPPSHSYCRICLRVYNRDRWRRKKEARIDWSPVQPGDDKAPKRRGRKPKPVAVPKAKRKPGDSQQLKLGSRKQRQAGRRYDDLVKPPTINPIAGAETVEQFLARGGRIQQAPTGYMAKQDGGDD